MRNRGSLPELSSALGTRFCGNGDLLAFVTGASRQSGRRREGRPLDPAYGPVITSAIRVPDVLDGGSTRGYYLEDGGYPEFVNWIREAADMPGTINRMVRFAFRRLVDRITRSPRSDLSAEMRALVGQAASANSLVMLGMGRDIPDGVMSLRSSYLDIDWTIESSKAYFDHMIGTMEGVADTVGGKLIPNPTWRLGRVITVHPLGGAPMAEHPGEGVVDSYGEVFGYPNLYVMDGSVMPGPVGPNPALTIAAFAERAASHIVEKGD
jgi:cholesterol oxidase